MWTVAVEWQIYFLFALFLLPIWRHAGDLPTMGLAIGIGLIAPVLLPANTRLNITRLWYLGLFAMGMAAATVNFGQRARQIDLSRRVPWGWLVVTVAACVATIEALYGEDRTVRHLWAMDLLVGGGTACMLVFLAGVATTPNVSHAVFGRLLARTVESRAAVTLGAFSYSMYLVHFPLMWIVKFAIQAAHLSPIAELASRLTIAPIMIAAASFGFYWVFERPFASANAPRVASETIPPLACGLESSNESDDVITIAAAI